MKPAKFMVFGGLLAFTFATAQAAVTSSTVHGLTPGELDPMIAVGDLISGQIGVELAGDLGWHPANTDPADQLPAFTDGVGDLSGLTGLLNDFPPAGAPTKRVQYTLPGATDISRLQILSGNGGGDGRIFSTTVVSYSVNNGGSFNPLGSSGYFQSDPSGTLNNAGSSPRYYSTMVSIYDDSSPLLQAGVTDLIFEFYGVDNTLGQMRDPFDGVNPFTGFDDGLTAPNTSPLIWEIDVLPIPEPSTLALLVLGLLALRRGKPRLL
jgi:hypothetical protein